MYVYIYMYIISPATAAAVCVYLISPATAAAGAPLLATSPAIAAERVGIGVSLASNGQGIVKTVVKTVV
jgi:hypothetical protein